MSFFGSIQDGSFFHAIAGHINSAVSTLTPEAHQFVSNVAKITPALTTAATVAETLTGNAELVPLTKQAGEAVNQIANHSQSLADIASTVTAQLYDIANVNGDASTAQAMQETSKRVQDITTSVNDLVAVFRV